MKRRDQKTILVRELDERRENLRFAMAGAGRRTHDGMQALRTGFKVVTLGAIARPIWGILFSGQRAASDKKKLTLGSIFIFIVNVLRLVARQKGGLLR